MSERYVSRVSLAHEDAPRQDFDRLTELEKSSGYRTGTRFSLEGRTVYEITACLETGRFVVSAGDGEPFELTREIYDSSSGLCYWNRSVA